MWILLLIGSLAVWFAVAAVLGVAVGDAFRAGSDSRSGVDGSETIPAWTI